MKACTKCGIVKILEAFPKRSNRPSGRGSQCKACMSKRYMEWQKTKKGKESQKKRKEKHRDADLAKMAVANAVRRGKLKRAPCVICGKSEHVHAHHDNYSRRLDVVWLCAFHHRERHISLKAGYA